jgi:cytochrome c553
MRRLPTTLHPSGAGPWLLSALAFAILVSVVVVRHDLGAAQADATPQNPPAMTPSAEQFEAQVRPVLSGCLDCHGADAAGGLRVDSREALLQGGDSGPALVPGKPEDSLLIKAVQHVTGFPRMPQGRSKLRDSEIAILVDWIRAGAPWPGSSASRPAPAASHELAVTAEHRGWWAFQPLASPAPPATRDRAWPRSAIDRFILARLEQEGLRPVAPADKLTLLRRATLDLTGLPPTPDEVDAFLADATPGAFAKVVDRLLSSPRYGEKWARMWLDVARYGEDDYRSLDPQGRGHNPYPNAYLYRDWVIKAFNDDLPYDQFVTAQLAADLMDERVRLRMLPALGFLGLGPWFFDNGAVEITRADERNDRVDAVSRGFLALTVACARCHDHKYDPIPTKDYYALAGVFLNSPYKEYPLAPKSVVDAYDALQKKIERKQELLGTILGDESRRLAETLLFQSAKYMQAAWKVTGEPKTDRARTIEADKLDYELFDRWLRFLEKPPTYYPFLKSWQEMVKAGGTAARAKALADDFQELLVDLVLARKDVEDENDIIRAKALPTTKPRKPANKPNEFVTNDDFCPGCGLELKSMPIERTNLYTDVFQRDLDSTVNPGEVTMPRPGLLSFRGWGLERQLGPDRRALIEALRADIRAMEKEQAPPYPYVHGVGDAESAADLKVSLRGSPYRFGDDVPRGFLTVLSAGERQRFSKGSGRLELAQAIVAQPIAARAIVNRIWKGHFGTGLVDTPSNFGRNGERPTHPELLDYLAQSFQARGRSLKALHREIMLSAVYQLGSATQPAALEKDAGNRLYWRATRRRMTAEEIRDGALFVAGALDGRMGGPSVALTPFEKRRTIYGRVSRYKLDEFLALFDFPSPSQSAEQRIPTNVPLQRLFFMNSDFMQQQAELLAERVVEEASDAVRIQKLYKILFGRAASPAEVQAGLDYLASEPMRQYEERRASAKEAEKPGAGGKPAAEAADAKPAAPEAPPPPGPPAADGMMAGVRPGAGDSGADAAKRPVTTLGRYVKVLLSSNEFLFVN